MLDTQPVVAGKSPGKEHVSASYRVLLYISLAIGGKDKRFVIIIYFLNEGHISEFVNLPN